MAKSIWDEDTGGGVKSIWDEDVNTLQTQPEKQPERTLKGTIGDVANVAVQGAMGVAEIPVGLANLATGGRFGKELAEVGLDFKKGRQAANDLLKSDAQKWADKQVDDAEGIVDTAKAAISNPSTIASAVGESLPTVGAGGVVARGVMKAAPKLSAFLAAAIGEGVTAMGSSAEGIRQETKDGLLTGEQSALAAGSGALTGLLGFGGGKFAKKLGLDDIDVAMLEKVSPSTKAGLVKRILGGAVSEGLIEEMPQSAQEQIAQNIALGRDWNEGLDKAIVMGTLAGGVMGGAVNARARQNGTESGTVADIIASTGGVLDDTTRAIEGTKALAANAFADVAGDDAFLQQQTAQRGLVALSLSKIAQLDGEEGLVKAIGSLAGQDTALADRLLEASQNPELVNAGRQALQNDVMTFIELNDAIRTSAGLVEPMQQAQAPQQELQQPQAPQPSPQALAAGLQAVRDGIVNGAVLDEQTAAQVDLNGLAVGVATGPDGRQAVVVARDNETVQQAVAQAAEVGLEQVQAVLQTPADGVAAIQTTDGATTAMDPQTAAANADRVAGVRTINEELVDRLSKLPQEQPAPAPATGATEAPLTPEAPAKKSAAASFSPTTQTGAATRLIEGMNAGFGLQGAERIRADSITEVKPKDRGLNRMAAAVKTAFGVDVVFVSAPNGLVRENGQVFNQFRGVADRQNKTIYLDAGNPDVALNVFGHELVHILETEQPEIYDRLELVVLSRMRAQTARELRAGLERAMRAENGAEGQRVADEFRREVVAEAVGEMAQDAGLWTEIFDGLGREGTKAKTFYDKVLEVIAKLQRALTSSGYMTGVKDIAQVKKAIVSAYKDWAAAEENKSQDEGLYLTKDEQTEMRDLRKLSEQSQKEEDKAAKQKAKADAKAIDAEMDAAAKAKAKEKPVNAMPTQNPGRLNMFPEDDISFARLGERSLANEQAKAAKGAGSSDVGHRRQLDGRYVGAPDWVGNSPQRLAALREQLRKLAREGEPGRYWYEQSSRAILKLAGGDRAEAEKIVSLIAIYSPNATVPANTTMALTAYYQYKAGLPIKAGLGMNNRKAEDLLRHNKPWGGIKTNSFYQNLMVEIDPSKLDPGVATMDMWVALAFDYGDKKLGAGPKYKFAERETQRLADELGWSAHQVQAAIWVAIKARVESSAAARKSHELKTGIAKYETEIDPKTNKAKQVYTIQKGRERDHFKAATRFGLQHKLEANQIEESKYDFSHALADRSIQLSWEATPGDNTGVLPGLLQAPFEQQMEYLVDIRKALTDADGKDAIAKLVGIPEGETVNGVSAWEGATGAGAQTFVSVSMDGAGNNRSIRPASKLLLDAYAAVRGLLLRQKAVVYHAAVYDASTKNDNGVELRTNRPVTRDEMQQLYDLLIETFETQELAPAFRPDGVRILNFVEGLDNGKFHNGMDHVVARLPEGWGGGLQGDAFWTFKSVGNYIANDWNKDTQGEGYKAQIAALGLDLSGGLRDLQSRVAEVNRRYSEKYGWGDPGRDISFKRSLDPVPRQQPAPVYGQEGRPNAVQVTAWHFSTEPRSTLTSSSFGTGLRGSSRDQFLNAADPRSRQRVYFYVDKGNGIHPESGVGGSAHDVTLRNVYDFDADPLKLKRGADWQAFETALMDAGFDGYLYREHNLSAAVVLVGPHNVPVAYRGVGKDVTRPGGGVQAQTQSAPASRLEGDELVRRPNASELSQLIRNRAVLKESAPSFRMEFGEARVNAAERDAANAVLAAAGSNFSFARSPRIDSPEFKAWFKDSKIVNSDGSPKVMYHGTARDIRAFRAKQANAIFVTDKPRFAAGFADASRNWMAENLMQSLTPEGKEAARVAASQRIEAEYPDDPFIQAELQASLDGALEAGVMPQGEAGDYFREAASGGLDSAENIMPLYASVQNPFDYENEAHLAAIEPVFRANENGSLPAYQIGQGLWSFIESKGVQRAIREAGFDGFYVLEGGVKNLAVYRSEQLKSVTGNRGTYDASNPDITFARNALKQDSVADVLQMSQTGKLNMDLGDAIEREAWADAYQLAKNPAERKTLLRSLGDTTIEKFADSKVRLSRWIQGLLHLGNNLRQSLEGSLRRADTLRSRMEKDVKLEYTEPMFKAITAAAKATKMSTDQIKKMAGYWMTARYATEANAWLIQKDRVELQRAIATGDQNLIAAAQQNLNQRIADVNGAIGAQKVRGVAGGMNNAEAAQIVLNIERMIPRQHLDEISKPIYDMMAWKRQEDLNSGKVSQTTVNSWLNSPHYVPLTGDPRHDRESTDVFSAGNQINQDPDKAMNGRKDSVADDAIDAAFAAVVKTINFSAIQEFKRNLNQAFEESQQQGVDIGLTREPISGLMRTGDNVIIYRDTKTARNGVQSSVGYAFRFRDERIMEALRKDNVESVNALLKVVQAPTRWYARAVTQFMPMFAPVNFVRDIWERSELLRTRKLYAANGTQIDVKRAARKSIANSINPLVWQATTQKAFKTGRMTPVRQQLEEMVRLGGASTWGDYLDRTARDLEASIRSDGHKLGHARNVMMSKVESWNESFEMVPTLSIYMALKEQGMDPKDAAAAVLDLMNFRKRGTAMPGIRALYVFAQPAATSGYNLMQYLSTPVGQKRFAAQVIVGTALYAMLKGMWGGDDDDEIGNQLDNLSNYTVERTIPIKIGDVMVKVPVGFGPPQLAWLTAGVINRLESGRYEIGDALGELGKGWAKSFAPVAPSDMELMKRPVDFFIQTFTPTVLRPIFNIYADQTNFGAPLTPEFKDPDKLKSEQAKRNTEGVYSTVAKFAYDTLGVDVYPDHLKAVADGYLVGPFRILMDWYVGNPAKELRGEPTKNALVNQIVENINDRQILNSVYTRVRNDLHEAHLKYAAATRDEDARGEITPEMAEMERIYKTFEAREKLLGVQRSALRKMDLEDDVKAERVQEIEQRSDEARRELLRDYFANRAVRTD